MKNLSPEAETHILFPPNLGGNEKKFPLKNTLAAILTFKNSKITFLPIKLCCFLYFIKT